MPEPEPLNLGVPVVNFPRANAFLARAQALLWVRDCRKHENEAKGPKGTGPLASFSCLSLFPQNKDLFILCLFPHLIIKIQNYFLCMC